MNWLEFLNMLAYDSWSSPESVTTAIVAIVGALSAAITAIIGAIRCFDRKKGRECCRVTGKKLNKTKKEKKDS